MGIYMNDSGVVKKVNISAVTPGNHSTSVRLPVVLGLASVGGKIAKFYDYTEDLDYLEYSLYQAVVDETYTQSMSDVSPYATISVSNGSDGKSGSITFTMTDAAKGHEIYLYMRIRVHLRSVTRDVFMYRLYGNEWGSYIPWESSMTASITYSRRSSGSWSIDANYNSEAYGNFIDLGSTSATKTVVYNNSNPGVSSQHPIFLSLKINNGSNSQVVLSMKTNYMQINGSKIPIVFTNGLT